MFELNSIEYEIITLCKAKTESGVVHPHKAKYNLTFEFNMMVHINIKL